MGEKEDRYRATGRADCWLIPPENLTIVKDPDHPLFDEEGNDLPLSESLVLNIMSIGVKKPVIVRLNGKDSKDRPIIEVVEGRQRVKNAIEANKRLKKLGSEPHAIRCIAEKGEDTDLIATMIAGNLFVQERSIMSRVKHMKRLLNAGKTTAECALILGCSVGTIVNYNKILECSEEVQKALDKGNISAEAAKVLSELPREKQDAALKQMTAEGVTKGRAAINAAERAKKGKKVLSAADDKLRMKRRVFIEWFRDAIAEDHPDASAVLDYILGNENAMDSFPSLYAVLTDAPGSKPVKEKSVKKIKRVRREAEELD